MARILVIIEKGENSYGAYSPDVPGCVAVGDTREEVEQLMKEALQEHLQMMREENLPLPQSQTEGNIWTFRFQHKKPCAGYVHRVTHDEIANAVS